MKIHPTGTKLIHVDIWTDRHNKVCHREVKITCGTKSEIYKLSTARSCWKNEEKESLQCHGQRHCTLPFFVTDNQMVRQILTASKLTSLCHQQFPVSCHAVLQRNLHQSILNSTAESLYFDGNYITSRSPLIILSARLRSSF